MRVRVIRGSNQIGGSVIEICSDKTRLILDVGSELGEWKPIVPDVPGLFFGAPHYDAVLVSHYHSDHMGLIDKVVDAIPVYLGEKTAAVYQAQAAYKGAKVKRNVATFSSGNAFEVGDIRITPFLCDHSAFDSHMFLLEQGGERVLYTGDFRSNGRKSFKKLLACLPKVNTLIIEGTTLSGSHRVAQSESRLEDRMVEMMRERGGAPVFVNMASTNIDRIVTMFRAAKRTDRIFLEDTYTATITSVLGGNIPNPAFPEVRCFLTRPSEKDYAILQQFPESKIGRNGISRNRFVMMVRPSMKGYLEKLAGEMDFNGGLLVYSLWEGYKKDERVVSFLESMQRRGLEIVSLHASGHADERSIDALIRKVDPSRIIPVHTENASWFERYCEQGIRVRDELG